VVNFKLSVKNNHFSADGGNKISDEKITPKRLQIMEQVRRQWKILRNLYRWQLL